MNLRFTARGATPTPEMREYCDKRIRDLLRFFDKIIDIDVTLSSEKNRQTVDIHVKAKGGTTAVSEETNDMMDSLRLTFDSLEKKLKKEREKWREKRRRSDRELREASLPEEEPAEPELRIIRTEACSHKPISVAEAIVLMRDKNQDVFLFRRDDAEGWAVIYKRKDGHIGLIKA